MKTIHEFARDLRPVVLDDIGLVPALKSHTADFTQRTKTPVRLKISASSNFKDLNTTQRTAFFRIAQEGLSNVAKHAKASFVTISLEKRDGFIHMAIKDNGKSFSVERMMLKMRRKRLGLIGMRERMEMIGGTFSITSNPGKGTVVNVLAPIKISNGENGKPKHARKTSP